LTARNEVGEEDLSSIVIDLERAEAIAGIEAISRGDVIELAGQGARRSENGKVVLVDMAA
jgi:hypothetical protein